MKKITYCVIVIFASVALFVAGYTAAFKNDFSKKEDISRIQREPLQEDDVRGDDILRTDSAGINTAQSYIRHSGISGYLMRAEEKNVNIYEIYENGYLEKIKVLDINPEYMRKTDREILAEGIRADSYDEMCSLIEDFSS